MILEYLFCFPSLSLILYMEECEECTPARSECQARRLKRKRVCVERGSGRGEGMPL